MNKWNGRQYWKNHPKCNTHSPPLTWLIDISSIFSQGTPSSNHIFIRISKTGQNIVIPVEVEVVGLTCVIKWALGYNLVIPLFSWTLLQWCIFKKHMLARLNNDHVEDRSCFILPSKLSTSIWSWLWFNELQCKKIQFNHTS